jgi:hypothetical protein
MAVLAGVGWVTRPFSRGRIGGRHLQTRRKRHRDGHIFCGESQASTILVALVSHRDLDIAPATHMTYNLLTNVFLTRIVFRHVC